ncbi:unnamed protein product [Laminaria digitata]
MSSSLRIAATPESLQEVSFVNPNAQQARCQRRRKLAASRARVSAMAACGGTFPGAGGDGFAASTGGEKNVRKQKRMLRNRESAALSRKRKNDLIGELEIQVEALKQENRRLRQRVDGYESDAPAGGAAAGRMDVEPLPTPTQRTLARAPGMISPPSSTSGSIAPPTVIVSPSPRNNNFFDFDPAASPWGSATTTTCAAAPAAAAACFNNIVSRPAVFA